jgi:ribosome-binding protein aMBF1 (putative translation factor)
MRLGPLDLRQESEDFYVGHTLDAALQALLSAGAAGTAFQCRGLQAASMSMPRSTRRRHRGACAQFANGAARDLRRLLDSDVLAAYHGDPAARSVDEVLLCYPGVLAMIHHRLAHAALQARAAAARAHRRRARAQRRPASTSIPARRSTPGFFIDHGTGVVIGETAVIGKRVRLYQAVTLGAKRFPADADGHLQQGPAAASGRRRRRGHLRGRHHPGPRHARQGRDHRRQRLDHARRAAGCQRDAGQFAERTESERAMKAFVEDFGVTVRQLREANGWSQEQLAERSDLNRSYVGEVERGRVIPSIVTAQKLATALGINIVNLLARCEQLEQSRLARRINLAAIAC